MLRLRPYKPMDAAYLLRFVGDERAFAMWCAGRFSYPLTEAQLTAYYRKYEADPSAFAMTALAPGGAPAGHFLMRAADYEAESVRLGFIIVDPALRGKGYGKEMVALGIRYAFDLLGMKKVTLGVFENNPAAHHCYRAAGLRDTGPGEAFLFHGETWPVMEMAITR